MGIFDLFKRKNAAVPIPNNLFTLSSVPQGPTFLEGFTALTDNPEKLEKFEWRRLLCSPSGGRKFRIKYYGVMHEDYPGLLIGTDFAPILVLAIDPDTNNEILLFDGCRHGYNAMFCDAYSDEQRNGREAANLYKDGSGNEVFEIELSAYQQMSEDEFLEMIDKNGCVTLIDGTVVKYDVAWRNCYDSFGIWAINEAGERINVVSEELA